MPLDAEMAMAVDMAMLTHEGRRRCRTGEKNNVYLLLPITAISIDPCLPTRPTHRPSHSIVWHQRVAGYA